MFDAADPDPDYEFVWPRELFKDEVTALLRLPSASWPADAELLLDEAFAGIAPQDDLATVSWTARPSCSASANRHCRSQPPGCSLNNTKTAG